MKKIYYLLILLTAATTLKAQKSATFKFKYKPNHTYNMTVKTDMGMNMSMNADSATMAAMAGKGMKQPMVMAMNTDAAVTIKTTAPNEDKNIPFTMTYNTASTKMSINGEEKPMPANPLTNQTIKGVCEPDGKMDVDTINGGGSSQLKATLRQIMDHSLTQIKFPDKPLAIGESFTDNRPMSIPAGFMNLNYVLSTTYTLTDIKSGLAYFDTKQSIVMDIKTQVKGTAMTGAGTGTGTGKAVFSIANNYPTAMVTDIAMNFTMDMGVMKMAMDIKAKTAIENTISAN